MKTPFNDRMLFSLPWQIDPPESHFQKGDNKNYQKKCKWSFLHRFMATKLLGVLCHINGGQYSRVKISLSNSGSHSASVSVRKPWWCFSICQAEDAIKVDEVTEKAVPTNLDLLRPSSGNSELWGCKMENTILCLCDRQSTNSPRQDGKFPLIGFLQFDLLAKCWCKSSSWFIFIHLGHSENHISTNFRSYHFPWNCNSHLL